MSDEWRTFVAIELSPEIRDQLRAHATQVRETVTEASASWSQTENIHLTLKFFGNIPTNKLPLISDAASRVVRHRSAALPAPARCPWNGTPTRARMR